MSESNPRDKSIQFRIRSAPIETLFPATTTEVYDTYWKFAAERQAIFFRRFSGEQRPWTRDPILAAYKFTNAYRAADRVSQFLIRKVIYSGHWDNPDLFFRIILFKLFNKIETWTLLERELGPISFREYSFRAYNQVLSNAFAHGQRIYSPAYIMASPGGTYGYARKHENHLRLLETMMDDLLPERIVEADSMKMVFELLQHYPSIGEFLAYQYAIDINYSTLTNFSEMDFVVPGPGAVDGIHKCFSNLGHLNYTDVIKLVTDRQQYEFDRLGLKFQTLWGRPLHLIDCQNLFCEVGKYARLAHPSVKGIADRKKIKQRFTPARQLIQYIFPPKWRLRVPKEAKGNDYDLDLFV